MPIHDWTRVSAGTFHDFHQAWITELRNALNAGVLPHGFFAMADQVVGRPLPDVITLQRASKGKDKPSRGGGLAIADAPPQARYVRSVESDIYARRADRIAIRHELGKVVAVIEIVSPGNKNSAHGLRSFLQKTEELLWNGVNLLVVDLFPPSPRDPQGIHKEIWDTVASEEFHLPDDKPLTVAAYSVQGVKTAYVEPVAVGDSLPSLPIFLDDQLYVPAPLEPSYQVTWDKCPDALKELFDARTTQLPLDPRAPMQLPGAQ
jgi:hypothetical protein